MSELRPAGASDPYSSPTSPLPQYGRIALAAAGAPGTAEAAHSAWAEVIALGDERVGLVVADSAPRAVPTAQLRHVVADALRERLSPARALEALGRCGAQHPGPSGAAQCAVLDGGTGTLLWSGAGSSAPLVVGPAGRRLLTGDDGSTPGQVDGAFRQREVAVEAGATVVLGAGGADDDGFDDLATSAARHQDLAPDELATLLAATGSRAAEVLLLARLIPAPLGERLPTDARRLPAMRRRLGSWSALAALSDDTTADLQLMLSEAATNSVEHAYRDDPAGEFVYSVRRRDDGAIRVEVQDFGRWRPPPTDPGYRGRGLAVIHNLADEVTLEIGESGTRVAFTVPGNPPPLAQRRPAAGPAQWWATGDSR
jgi:anti-sigma regulatory factor (Ser/Thr protein kinase)